MPFLRKIAKRIVTVVLPFKKKKGLFGGFFRISIYVDTDAQ